MKFLCDRCKTRYSIGDDRVRGKILKIRCKNCANVITVREGMADPDAAEAGAAPAPAGANAARRLKPTTMSPPVTAAAPAATPAPNGGALGAAFASAMTRPPPALEEEWYVSIDGEQEGPFSLVEAQRWVGAKAFDADLHCWSEGFDDWLPVDKVSHFRGLRKRPAAPTAPPPLPSRGTGGVPALRAQPQARPVEEEPKPLFAATMASLERSAGASGAGLAMPTPNGVARPSASPPLGQPRYPSPIGGSPAIPSIGPAKQNGSSTGPAKALQNVPMIAPKPAPAVPGVGKKSGPVPPVSRAETRPGVGNAFDVGDQATQIDSPAFDLEAQTRAEPVAAQAKRNATDGNDAFAKALGRDSGSATAVGGAAFDGTTNPTVPATPRHGAAQPAAALPQPRHVPDESDDDDSDDGLAIGEVSRVVKLADLTKSAPKPRAVTAPPVGRATQSSPSLSRTGAVAKMNATAPVARIEDPNGFSPTGLATDPSAPGTEMAMVPAPVATSHKRGMLILIGAAVLLIAGVVVAVVVFGGEETVDKGLGRGDQIDTTRPDDPLRPRNPGDVAMGSNGSAGSATGPSFPPKNNGSGKRPTNSGNNTNQNTGTNSGSNTVTGPELPTGDSLTPEDIDVVSKKYSTGTQRCYMRAQKGVEALTIGPVKSIQAMLTVGKDGVVTGVTLASHADDSLGKCLITALRGWRFRANPGGQIRFTLAFAQQ